MAAAPPSGRRVSAPTPASTARPRPVPPSAAPSAAMTSSMTAASRPASLAFTHTSLDTRGTGDDSSAKGWHGFAYATWVDNGWFLDGIAGGNWFDNSYKRTTIGG